jgi:hypothetical protein
MKNKLLIITSSFIILFILCAVTLLQLGIFDSYLLNSSMSFIENNIDVNTNTWQYFIYSNKLLINIIAMAFGIGQYIICDAALG